ncbi:Uncharacterised protein [Klebsiella pneumoniae]|nr:Uncharacterised protein [Klebsiella pneumoniae]
MVVIAADALDRLRHQDEVVLLQRLEDAIHHHHFIFQILLNMAGAAALHILRMAAGQRHVGNRV